jgi:hypothetical protein
METQRKSSEPSSRARVTNIMLPAPICVSVCVYVCVCVCVCVGVYVYVCIGVAVLTKHVPLKR